MCWVPAAGKHSSLLQTCKQPNATGRCTPLYSTMSMKSWRVITLKVPSTLPSLHIVRNNKSLIVVKTRTLKGSVELCSSSSSNQSIFGKTPRFDGLPCGDSLSSDVASLLAPSLPSFSWVKLTMEIRIFPVQHQDVLSMLCSLIFNILKCFLFSSVQIINRVWGGDFTFNFRFSCY